MHCDGTTARRIVDEKAPNNKILVESSTSDYRLTLNRIDLSSEQHERNDVHSHSNRWHSRHYISHHSERRHCGKHIYAWRCRFIRWLQWGRYQQYDHEIQRLHHLHGIQEDSWRGALVREQCGIVVFVIESVAQANRSPWLAGIWAHVLSFPPSFKIIQWKTTFWPGETVNTRSQYTSISDACWQVIHMWWTRYYSILTRKLIQLFSLPHWMISSKRFQFFICFQDENDRAGHTAKLNLRELRMQSFMYKAANTWGPPFQCSATGLCSKHF